MMDNTMKKEDPAKSRKNKDRGDPRGSRQPETKIRTTDVEEKGDKRRPFQRRGKD